MLISGNRPSSPPSFIGWGQTPIPGRFFQSSYAKMHMPSAFPILFGIIHVPFDSFISQNEGNAEMYTSCHNYGHNYGDVYKVHRSNGFTTDGGFCEYQVNNINTLVAIQDDMSDEEGALVVTAGTAMYALIELGGLVAGESVVVSGAGPIGLMAVAVAKALGAQPVILTEMRDNRLKIGLELGADAVVNIRKEPD